MAIIDGSVTIPKPAPIDRLPYELRQLVISYLDDDAYTLLNLTLVSKVWYVTLTNGKQAEEDWHRRCKRMDAKRKSLRCPTWYLTFIDLLHKRCILCFHSRQLFALEPFMPYGFKFLKLCEQCPSSNKDGPMSRIPIGAMKTSDPKLADHLSVACGFWVYDCYSFMRYYIPRLNATATHMLQVTVDQAKVRFDKEENVWRTLVETCPLVEKKTVLAAAIAHVREKTAPSCQALDEATKTLRETVLPQLEQYSPVIRFFELMQAVLAARDEFFEEHKIDTEKAYPELRTLTHLEEGVSKPWLEAIVLGRKTKEDYLDVVLQHKKEREEEAERRRLARLEILRYQKELDEVARHFGPYVHSLCIMVDCPERASRYCSQVKCRRHCIGPCLRHEKPFPCAFLTEEESVTLSNDEVYVKEEEPKWEKVPLFE